MSKHNDHPAVGFDRQLKWDGFVSSYRQARHSLQFKVALQLVLVLLLVVAGTVVAEVIQKVVEVMVCIILPVVVVQVMFIMHLI